MLLNIHSHTKKNTARTKTFGWLLREMLIPLCIVPHNTVHNSCCDNVHSLYSEQSSFSRRRQHHKHCPVVANSGQRRSPQGNQEDAKTIPEYFSHC